MACCVKKIVLIKKGWGGGWRGRRLTPIKITLSRLLVYFMSLFVILKKINLKLEKIQPYILWGGGAMEKKPHRVN